MIITNLLFKTHNCRKIRSPTKIWGRVSAHVILAFLSDGHLLTFSTLKVPTTAIRSSITTQLFLFLSISAQLSQFAALGLSLSLVFSLSPSLFRVVVPFSESVLLVLPACPWRYGLSFLCSFLY